MNGSPSYDGWKLRSDRDDSEPEELCPPRPRSPLWQWAAHECPGCGVWPLYPGVERCEECEGLRRAVETDAAVMDAICGGRSDEH